MLYLLSMMIMCFLLITIFTWRKIYIKTSTMAAVMAIGIITQGVLTNYFGSEDISFYGKLLSILNISLWLSFLFSLVLALRNKQFRNIHYENPINRFGIGTWIAGTSICSILICNNFPGWILFVKYLTVLNILLWMTYITISIIALRDIYRLKLTKDVHGILLLTTVSTQSLVLLLNTVFNMEMVYYINVFLILMGIILYLVCLMFIINRYSSNFENFNIEADWKNTNCILHGAVSITGLACIFSHAVHDSVITVVWVVSATAFLVVEVIEINRLFKRIKRYGIQKGIFVYDVTQWSRIFTFGMFYAFTFKSYTGTGWLSQTQSLVIHIGVWVILLLIIIELILSMRGILSSYQWSRMRVKG
ncbi:hypothetical protein F9U64_11945 [Gracilibacillus oryzae]|uniref:Voltage-dependent anion channel n=1 Tax=Gracilibacillus oryzae TaxID=1672701 RepID=A0A7C8GSL6_9BACI|nr:hypothetical protein [Gracilibacillus oryzae]KAB8133614.1 hypothetical protein F9U64_11945 [Gracilibacillus oryzae]